MTRHFTLPDGRQQLSDNEEMGLIYRDNLRTYGEKLKATGRPLPASRKRIAEEAKVPEHFLRKTGKIQFEALLADLGREDAPPSGSTSRTDTEEYARRFATWAATQVEQGASLPGRRDVPSQPSLEGVARAANVSVSFLRHGGSSALRNLVDDLKVAPHPTGRAQLTLGAILEPALTWRREQLRADGKPEADAANLKTAIRKLIEQHGKDARAIAVAEAKLKELAGTDQRKSRQQIRLLCEFLGARCPSADTHTDLQSALRSACRQCEMSLAKLASRIGVSQETIYQWGRSGRVRIQYKSKLAEAERVLHQMPGTFTGSAVYCKRDIAIPLRLYPLETRDNHKLRTALRERLPRDYHEWCESKIEAELARLWTVLRGEKQKRAATRSTRENYRAKELPSGLAAEFARIVEVKTATRPQKRRNGESPASGKTRWTPDTVRIRKNGLRSLTGFLSQPKPGGPELDADLFRLGHLANPKFVENVLHDYLNWRCGDDDKLTHFYHDELRIYRSWVDPSKTPRGLIVDMGDYLAERLVPLPGVLDEADILKMKSNWLASCQQAMDAYNELLENWWSNQREEIAYQELVRPLLESDAPLQGVTLIVNGLRRELALLKRGKMDWAHVVRSLLYIGIAGQHALRTGTFSNLPLSCLIERDAKWWLEIPRVTFKNEHCDALKDRTVNGLVRLPLEDFNGLYQVIREYLGEARDVILRKGKRCDALFVSAGGRPLDPHGFAALARRLSAQFVVWNETTKEGFPGITKPFPNHCFRALLATHVLKHTGSEHLAALSILDSVRTVIRHYARWRAADWIKSLTTVLRQALEPSETESQRPQYPLPAGIIMAVPSPGLMRDR